MKVIHFNQAEKYEPEPDWRRVSLCSEPNVSIEYFVKPPHHASPVHEHPNEQVSIVTKGKMLAIAADGTEELLEEGDAAYFPASEPHAIKNALDEPSVGIDVFAPGRSFDFWLKRLKK